MSKRVCASGPKATAPAQAASVGEGEAGFRISGFGCRDSGFRFRVSGFGFRVSGFGFRLGGVRTVAARRVGEVDLAGLLHLDVREGALTPPTMTQVNLSTPQPFNPQPLNTQPLKS